MDFNQFCKYLDRTYTTKGHSDKTKVLKSFFQTLRKNNYNIFQHLRLIVPELDRERQSYRIKESKLVRILSKMLALPKGPDTERLEQIFKVPTNDMGDIIYSIVKKYIKTGDGSITVDLLNQQLDNIANRENDSALDSIVMGIFKRLSPEGIKWFVQILLKNVKLGMGHFSILNSFHQDAGAFYKSNSSLRKLTEVLYDPSKRLHEIMISLFEPFAPMLSKRIDGGNFKKSFSDNKIFYVENKFDGERFQLHMQDGKFKYFSRNGFDYSNHFGVDYTSGILTPKLRNAFSKNINNLILDGEMMLWNKNLNTFGSKGLTYDVKNLKAGDKYQPCFCVFDVLMINNEIITNKPLKKRFQFLETVLNHPIEGVIMLSKKLQANSMQDIVNHLNDSIKNNEEGIVVKEPESIYKFGDRKSGWYKLKMDYFDNVVHDLDLLLMGGCYDSQNVINSCFIGYLSSSNKYTVMGRISSGLNADQLDFITEKFRQNGHKSNPLPFSLIFGSEEPEVYIKPEHSCLLQIRASELVRATSNSYRTPYTLRFPRVLAIRDDKPVDQCLTVAELQELTAQNKSVIKLNKRYLELDELGSKTIVRKKRKIDVIFCTDTEIGDYLANKTFFVYSGNDSWPVEKLCMSIKRAGGENVYDLNKKFDVLLTGKIDDKIDNLMKGLNYFHIVSIDWLVRVLECKKIVDFKASEILYYSRSFDNVLSINMDIYGDSFTKNTNKETLMINFARMKDREEFLYVNDVECPEFARNSGFSKYCAYFDQFYEPNNRKSDQIYDCFFDQIHFKYHRGVVSDTVREGVNLIVVENFERIEILKDFVSDLGILDVNIVLKDFIYTIN